MGIGLLAEQDKIAPFEVFTSERLNTPVYDPGERSEETQTFIIAQQSFRQLMGWTKGLRNAAGDELIIQSGYIERMTPNAVADRYQGVHYIGMHQALLVSCMEFALFALTQSCVFPNVGNAAGEASPELKNGKAPGILLLDKTLRGETVQIDQDHWRIPKDENRHVLAVYLAMLMARYIWLHELAHCTNGHVAYVQNAGLALRLYEVAEELSVVGFKPKADTDKQRDKIIRQLEYDADSSAFFGLCQIQLNDLENIDGIKALDIVTRLGMSIFAAYAVTWLFEEYQAFLDLKNDPSHPTPYDRLQHLARGAANEIAPKVDGFAEFHQSICDQFNAMAIPGLYQVGKAAPMDSEREFELHAIKSAMDKWRFY